MKQANKQLPLVFIFGKKLASLPASAFSGWAVTLAKPLASHPSQDAPVALLKPWGMRREAAWFLPSPGNSIHFSRPSTQSCLGSWGQLLPLSPHFHRLLWRPKPPQNLGKEKAEQGSAMSIPQAGADTRGSVRLSKYNCLQLFQKFSLLSISMGLTEKQETHSLLESQQESKQDSLKHLMLQKMSACRE